MTYYPNFPSNRFYTQLSTMRQQNILCSLTLIFLYVGLALCESSAYVNALDQQEVRSSVNDIESLDPSERFFFTSNALNFGGNGATSVTIGNAGYVVLGAYILVPLIIGLALLFYLIGGQGDRGYGGGDTYGSTGSSYASYARFVFYFFIFKNIMRCKNNISSVQKTHSFIG